MRAQHGRLAALALLIVSTGCAEEADLCASGEVRDTASGACVPIDFDAGPRDGGGDVDDAGPDGGDDPCMGSCEVGEICRPDGACVECTEDAPCASGQCELDSGTCVECVDDDHCVDPSAPVCGADNMCESGCTSGGDCSVRFPDQPYCDTDSGRCVECTVTNLCEGTQTCDLGAGTCVDIAPGSVTEECRACSNDLQCAADMRCIPLDFDGSPHGGYCLRPATTCTQPFAYELTDRTSVNGAVAADYCGVNEVLTTCEAAWAMKDNWTCDDDDGTWDGRCRDLSNTEVTVEGSICKNLGALGLRCTIRCRSNTQCEPSGSPAPRCELGAEDPGYCAAP